MHEGDAFGGISPHQSQFWLIEIEPCLRGATVGDAERRPQGNPDEAPPHASDEAPPRKSDLHR
jgi:hypothetical protein